MKKRCTTCNKTWNSIIEFIKDPDITLTGYQAGVKDIDLGDLAFRHFCGHSFTIPIQVVSYALNGPIYEEKNTKTFECPGNCVSGKRFRPCLTDAECTYVSKIVEYVYCAKKQIRVRSQNRCRENHSEPQ
jgi:hypothetical protein